MGCPAMFDYRKKGKVHVLENDCLEVLRCFKHLMRSLLFGTMIPHDKHICSHMFHGN